MPKRSKTDAHSLRHVQQRAAHDADQTEFAAVINGSTVVDAGIFDDRIADSMDDYRADDPMNVVSQSHRHDIAYDSAAGAVHEEILRRIDLLGDAYPFSLSGNNISHTQSKNLVYEFFLAICNSPNITANPYTGLPRIFERLSAQIVRGYMGVHTSAIHTGAPRDNGTSFREVMEQLNRESGEWIWGPEPELPDEPADQDGGVDFVTWKMAHDGRCKGQLFLLCQCACGNDWDTKLNDLNLRRLAKWFHPPWLVTPVRAFATPMHLVDGHLNEASRIAGVVFDRARLTMIANQAECADAVALFRAEITDLIALVIGDEAA